MKLTTTEDGKTTIITTRESRIDAVNATRFKDVMREIIVDRGKPALLDLRHVDFMDSSGLGALIAVHKAMPPGLSLTLANMTPNVERVFKLTRMDSVFHVLPPQQQQENG